MVPVSRSAVLLLLSLFCCTVRAEIIVKDTDGVTLYRIPDLNEAEVGIVKDDRDFPAEVVPNCSEGAGIVFCLVKRGAFAMGSTEGDSDEKPVHNVSLGHFYISKYPITNAQYEKYTAEQGVTHVRSSYSPDDNGPATNVSYSDALHYMEWLEVKIRAANGLPARPANPPGKVLITMYGLPTEAMWERASRGVEATTGERKYPWGSEIADDHKIYSSRAALKSSHATSAVTATVVPAGWGQKGRVFHMTGNVFCWCLDWYKPDYYERSESADPFGPDEDATVKSPRVIRGGTWYISNRSHRLTDRSSAYPQVLNERVGIRLVRFIESGY